MASQCSEAVGWALLAATALYATFCSTSAPPNDKVVGVKVNRSRDAVEYLRLHRGLRPVGVTHTS